MSSVGARAGLLLWDAAAADLLRIRTGRALLVLAAVCPVLVGITTAGTLQPVSPLALGQDPQAWRLLSTATVGAGPGLALGIVLVAGDHRHGALGAAVAATGRRGVVLLARAAAALLAGAVLGAWTSACALAGLLLWYAALGVPADALLPGGWLPLAGGVATTALYAVCGVAAAVLLRARAWVLPVALAWSYGVDWLLGAKLPDVERWLPGGAATGLGAGGTRWALDAGPSLALLAGWAALLLVLAAVSFHRWELRS